ncbi:hypothetical protein KM043_010367 [Ampulex compressa]|nr:hypothetical protein KM043_010367 [Ampulex compressa]
MAGEKRTQDQEETLLSETVILVDIEGTTTSISFVKETLFPYVRENLKKYIEAKWENEEFKQDLEKLKEQAKKDEEDKVDGFVSISSANTEEEKESVLKNVLWQMDHDRKTGALKQLQGHMWREAYNSGAVKGHVYEDVPRAFESWTNDSRKIYVYSSGSVEAQKLLFGNTTSGDLLKHFSGFFDTEVGPKQESSSYKNILSKIGAEPSTVIFLTDVVKEAEAAKEAGLSAVIVLREGNAALTDEERVAFTTIKSLLDLTFQTSTKRQKLETSEPEEKVESKTSGVSEPMDTSEDVEMSDVSENKSEKTEAKEAVEVEVESASKRQAQEPEVSAAKKDEPMITDTKDTVTNEKPADTEKADKTDSQLQSAEANKESDTLKSVPPVATDKKDSTLPTTENDKDKSMVAEKAEKPAAVATTEKTTESMPEEVTSNDAMDVVTQEPKSNTDQVLKVMEEKTDKATDIPKDANPEGACPKDVKSIETGVQKEKSDDGAAIKLEECAKLDKAEVKDESSNTAAINTSTIEKKKSESEDTPAKPVQETSEKTCTSDTAENGEVPAKIVEKVTAPTITEPEGTDSKTENKTEIKNTPEPATESKPETEKESENVDKVPKKDAEDTVTSKLDAEKHKSNPETTNQESKHESVKEESTVDEVKDKSTVDTEKKKLNGSTQNGDTDVPVSDDKLHRNGLNEGSSNEKLNLSASEATSAQNGEPESSSDASAESIKVKKVVDSTVADGAGEPDVVPPVVVAATS